MVEFNAFEAGPRPKLLAVASAGGHWVQLLRLVPAFQCCDVTFVTTNGAYQDEVPAHPLYAVNDASRWNKLGLLLMALKIFRILIKERPNYIISTGAAPGYIALRFGRVFGSRTIWVDSIANVDALSLSGRKVGRHADLWLTQWPHLATPEGPYYAGSVL